MSNSQLQLQFLQTDNRKHNSKQDIKLQKIHPIIIEVECQMNSQKGRELEELTKLLSQK